MSQNKAAGESHLEECLEFATRTAKHELGDSANKSVSARATLTVTVSENGKSCNRTVTAGVTLGVASSETDSGKQCACGCNCTCTVCCHT